MKWDPNRQGTLVTKIIYIAAVENWRPPNLTTNGVCLCRVFTPPGHGHLECLSRRQLLLGPGSKKPQVILKSDTLDHKPHFILSVKIRSKGSESNKRYTHDWTQTFCYCASHRRK